MRPTLALVAGSLDDLRDQAGPGACGGSRPATDRVARPARGRLRRAALRRRGRAWRSCSRARARQRIGYVARAGDRLPRGARQLELAEQRARRLPMSDRSAATFPAADLHAREEPRGRQAELTDTHVAQPALGATELGRTRAAGVARRRAGVPAGHSYGEFAALAAAGGIDAERPAAALRGRGRFMSEAAAAERRARWPRSSAARPRSRSLLAAGRRGDRQPQRPRARPCISGPREHGRSGRSPGAAARPARAGMLPVACAFHSPHVAGAQRRFAALLKRAELAAPRIPVYSNTTGEARREPTPTAIAPVLGRAPGRARGVRARDRGDVRRAAPGCSSRSGRARCSPGWSTEILGDREHLAVVDRPPGGSACSRSCTASPRLAAEGVPLRPSACSRGRRRRQSICTRLGRDRSRTAAGWLIDGGAQPGQRQEPRPLASPIGNRSGGADSRDQDEHER